MIMQMAETSLALARERRLAKGEMLGDDKIYSPILEVSPGSFIAFCGW
jgi:hypothetical protein